MIKNKYTTYLYIFVKQCIFYFGGKHYSYIVLLHEQSSESPVAEMKKNAVEGISRRGYFTLPSSLS